MSLAQSDYELTFSPTGTSNYLMTIFNNKSKDRDIMGDGAVPLHKTVYSMYDFFYQYIHQCPINTVYYFSVLLKPETDCRPEVRTLAKLHGKAKMAQRVIEATPIIETIIQQFYTIFYTFISKENTNHTQKSYRSDTNKKELINAFQEYETKVVKQLRSLINKNKKSVYVVN